jgi:hypothetical protein
LAIHEFESTDLPGEEIGITTRTEWSKKVLGSVSVFESDTWGLVGGEGRGGEEIFK